MDREQIKNKVVQILTSNEFGLQPESVTITEDTSLVSELVLDSLQLLDFIVALENAFGFKGQSQDVTLETFSRLGNVIDFIQGRLRLASVDAIGGHNGSRTA